MTAPHFLEAFEGPMKTQGACFPGQHVIFHGQDLHKSDLMGMDWIGLHVFGITGRKHSKAQQTVLNYIWTITSYPDARLWNNRVAALAGSTRSTGTLALAAAIAASEAINFGHQPMIHAADFLVRSRTKLLAGGDLTEIVQQELILHKHLGGYGRPVATMDIDERIPVLRQKMLEAGIDPFNPNNETNAPISYFALALEIEKVLVQDLGKKLTINYAGIMIAPALDFGFTVREVGMFMVSCFEAGMSPCYLEALKRPAGVTFPMRCAKLNYVGKQYKQSGTRPWDKEQDKELT